MTTVNDLVVLARVLEDHLERRGKSAAIESLEDGIRSLVLASPPDLRRRHVETGCAGARGCEAGLSALETTARSTRTAGTMGLSAEEKRLFDQKVGAVHGGDRFAGCSTEEQYQAVKKAKTS